MQVTREIQWFRVHDSLWSKSNTATRFNSRKRISETWLTSTTLWSCSCWMIKSHTVVFPDAVPPETPDPRRERKSNRGTHKHHIHMPLDFSPMRKCRKIIVINVSSFFYICKIKSIVRECKEQEKQRTEAVMFMYICMISLSFLLIKNNMYDMRKEEMSEAAATTTSSSMMRNYPLISAIVAFAIAQFIKFFTAWFVRFSFYWMR